MSANAKGVVRSRKRGRIAMPTKRYDSQLRAEKKYAEKKKKYTITFSPTELDVYEHLCQQSPKATYIKDLIRADMNKQQ